MYLPGPIYESIPAAYLLSGLVSFVFIEMPFSLISAVLFLFASWMVWKMRRDYRSQPDTNEDISMG